MRRMLWPLIILALSIITWLSTVKVTPLIANRIISESNECTKKTLLECKDVLSALGATGDVFGAMTSLFSGLALFAVAYTLWSDANSRRESKKPLIINYLDNNSITIKNPNIQTTSEIELFMTSVVCNKNGEAALNVSMRCEVMVGNKKLGEFNSFLKQPLVSEGKEEIEEVIKIKEDKLAQLLVNLTEDNKPVLLSIQILYNSLENVQWETRVSYNVSCKAGDRRKRLNSLRSKTDDFSDLWSNGAQVPLEVEVREGSWSHHRK